MKSSDRPESLLRRTIRRRWVLILAQWAILTGVLIYATWHSMPDIYRTAALLRVDPIADRLFEGPREDKSLPGYLQTQVDLIKSANILTAAALNPQAARLARLQGTGDNVLELRKVIQVQILPGTYLIEVSMMSPSAHEAATLVNAVVEAFNDSNVEWSTGMTRNQIKSLENYLAELKNQSTELEREWKEIVARDEGGFAPTPEATLDASLRRKISERLVENDIHRLEAMAELEALRRPGRDSPPLRAAELEARIEVAMVLDKTLRGRLASIPDPRQGRKPGLNEVDVTLVRQQIANLAEMEKAVMKRLEQLKFESRGQNRIRTVQSAIPSGRPIKTGARSLAMALIPIATLAFTLACFAGVEAMVGGIGSRDSGLDAEV